MEIPDRGSTGPGQRMARTPGFLITNNLQDSAREQVSHPGNYLKCRPDPHDSLLGPVPDVERRGTRQVPVMGAVGRALSVRCASNPSAVVIHRGE
jgi:hypothetical protein